jgi:hypothetical protein
MVDSTDLFRGVPTVTNNTFNISGGIQGGAVAVGGNAENSGSTQIHYNPQTIEAIQSELSKAERELHGCAIDPALKRQALEQVQAAKVDPVPDKIAKAISILNNVDSVVIKTAGAVSAIGTIGGAVAKLAGFL